MKSLYRILKILILTLAGFAFLQAVNAQAPDAPTALSVKASGSTELLLMWTGVPGVVDTSYVIQVSTDSVTFESADTVTVADTIVLVENLTAGTDYDIHVFALSASGNGDTAAVEGSTIVNDLVVQLEMATDTTVENTLNDSIDKLSSGKIEAISAAQSGIGMPAMKFIQDELGGINTYVRLYNTILPAAPSLLGRTVAFWMKNDQPSVYTVPISVCKRTGFSVAVKNGMLHAFTKHRPKYPSGIDWLADSTGVAFNSDEWTHVAYVFDNPVTRLYVNGVLKDESDGVFEDEGGHILELPFPTNITVEAAGDKSAEIGALVDPDAAMKIYLGDTWDPGPRNYFFGMLADIRMYNYSLSDEEVLDLAKASAPGSLSAQALGPDGVVLKWNAADAPEYQVEISTDSSTFEVVDTTEMTYFYMTDLDEGTDYYFRVTSLNPAGLGGAAGLKATTLTKAMVVNMPLDSLVGDTAIYNALDNSLDTAGTVQVIDAATSGLGIKATKFVQDELGGIQTYVRLFNTIVPADDSWTQRTVTFWMKNNQPGIYSVPISVCKRTGFSVAIKNGMIHAFTKHRPKFPSGIDWLADSTGAAFNSDMWTHVAYVFDHPVTRLYVNGALVDESDGIYEDEGGHILDLPFPTNITVEAGGDKSAEIGAQVDPDAATKIYLADTWDPGPRQFFDGMMAKLQMYNFALSDDSIKSLFDELGIKLEGLLVQASGAEDVVLKWNDTEGESGYKVETSTDGTTWTEAGEVDADVIAYRVGGLTEATTYHFRVTPEGVTGAVIPGVITGTTLSNSLVVHLEFSELVGDTAIQCSVSGALDNEIYGQVEINAVKDTITYNDSLWEISGINAIKFVQDELEGIQSYIRLYNTLLPAAGFLTDRTVAFWMKNEKPDMYSVPISVCKRTGFSVALKNGKIHAFTKHRPKYPSGVDWLADSTGAVFSSSDWTHVVYVFDDPVTRLFINGVLVDESNGIFEDEGGHILELPFPTNITVEAGGDKSAEIGAQVDPDAATKIYLGDTWDPGFRNAFDGELADLRIFNYSLSDAEVISVMKEHLTYLWGVSVHDIYYNRYSVYPNPTGEILFFSENIDAEISVFDNVGKLVLRNRLNQSNQLNISSLAEGVYYMRISTDKTTDVIKISVVR
jgi:hypothetical protein